MALNSDPAFKFGCGRYLQHRDAIGLYLQVEAERFGNKAFILCGENGYSAAHEKIERALSGSRVPYSFRIFHSTCCLENADELAEEVRAGGFDLVIGVGGGVLMDQAKLTASRADTALIQIPTSSATCAAVTPLSVMYSRDTGATIGSLKLMTEANAVLVDLETLIRQPKRLFCAGALDAMAKKIEIEHRYFRMDSNTQILGFDYAYYLSQLLFDQLSSSLDRVLEDMDTGIVTPDFDRAVFNTIAVTGIVSAVSKGSNQSAVAHRFYEECRTFFREKTAGFLHGELVAVGLLVQLAYSGSDVRPILEMLQRMKLPSCLSDLGIPADRIELFTEELCKSSAIQDSSEESREKIRNALRVICK